MSPLTAAPPRGAPVRPPARERALAAAGESRERREQRYRAALWSGLALSLLVHLAGLLVLGRLLAIGAAEWAPTRPALRPPVGLEVVRAVEAPAAPGEEAAVPRDEGRPVEEARPADRRARPEEAPAGPPRRLAEGERLTNAEKLQPREGDPRLWQDFADRNLPEGRAGFSRADSAVRAIVARLLDSLDAEQRRAAVEWLSGDGEWGVTPEGIRIGGVTIPINLGQLFAEEGPRGREARQEARDQEAIRRQDMLQDAEAVRKERREEMRERSREEAARREREAQETPPDTTRPLVPD